MSAWRSFAERCKAKKESVVAMCVRLRNSCVIRYHANKQLVKIFFNRLSHLWTADIDFYNKSMNGAFDKGKRASDFVGMITRMAFCLLGVSFFSKAWVTSTSWFDGSALGVCWLWSLAMYGYLQFQVGTVTLNYFLRDTTHFKGSKIKFLLCVSSLFFGLEFGRGMYLLVASVSSSAGIK